uniref:Zinc-ribbon domain-containing protein n=1 Tax=Schlesneria paludicola TaxID=360056 RepID=A0A7C2PC74_9PLAN
MAGWMSFVIIGVVVLVAVMIVLQMLLHTAVFGTVFYTILKQVQHRAAQVGPRKCAHCGTTAGAESSTCPQCGAPLEAGAAPPPP